MKKYEYTCQDHTSTLMLAYCYEDVIPMLNSSQDVQEVISSMDDEGWEFIGFTFLGFRAYSQYRRPYKPAVNTHLEKKLGENVDYYV